MYRRFLILALVLVMPACAFAQTSSSISITASPSYPEAGEAYELTLQASQNRSDITWFVDGSEVREYKNSNSISIKEGEKPKQIRARITLTDGSVIEKTYVANPYRVDLIMQSQTQTPWFYKGAALPSSGSDVTVHALVFNNNVALSGSYSYLWKIDGKIQNGGALFGKNSITFTPNFQTNVAVSVDVLTRDGALVTSEQIEVPIAEPEIQFYEVNPLRGMSHNALRDPHIFVGDELQVRAESYFMSTSPIASDIFTEWKLDGITVEPSQHSLHEITLQKEGISGTSALSFHIRNLKQVLQGVEDTLSIRF